MIKIETTFEMWNDGKLSDDEALRELARQYAALEDRLAPLEGHRKELRDSLSIIVDHAGGNTDIPGFGTLAITAPTVTTSYDAKALDALIARLVKAGQGDVAELIADCRKEGSRAGSLRINRVK